MIAAFAPATVSNVAAGFDVLGFALDQPGDLVLASLADHPGARLTAVRGDGGRLPREAGRNTASAAAEALLAALGTRQGVALELHKGLPLASGVGSSGASAVAAVVAVNELLGRPAGLDLLLRCAMAGEQAGCGAVHPDNVAPALYGGFVLARSADPPDIVRLPVPAGLACAVLHPSIEIHTGTARALLGDSVPLAAAVRQWANVGALVAALYSADWDLLSRALVDHVAEPKRAALVPGFHAIKTAAVAAGALGCSLSGSGPSIFALARSLEGAQAAGDAMAAAWREASPGVSADLWVSPVGTHGARIVTAEAVR
jgi:homoserine kinase